MARRKHQEAENDVDGNDEAHTDQDTAQALPASVPSGRAPKFTREQLEYMHQMNRWRLSQDAKIISALIPRTEKNEDGQLQGFFDVRGVPPKTSAAAVLAIEASDYTLGTVETPVRGAVVVGTTTMTAEEYLAKARAAKLKLIAEGKPPFQANSQRQKVYDMVTEGDYLSEIAQAIDVEPQVALGMINQIGDLVGKGVSAIPQDGDTIIHFVDHGEGTTRRKKRKSTGASEQVAAE